MSRRPSAHDKPETMLEHCTFYWIRRTNDQYNERGTITTCLKYTLSQFLDKEKRAVDTGGGEKDPGIKVTHQPDDFVSYQFDESNQSLSSLRGTSCLVSSNDSFSLHKIVTFSG